MVPSGSKAQACLGFFYGQNGPMSVSKMLSEFSERGTLPTDVNVVLSEIRERGVHDIIDFFRDIELDTKIIQGYLKREKFQKDGKIRFHSKIVFGKLGHEMERLVCCKELLHILDPDAQKVSDLYNLKTLIAQMSLPSALANPFEDEDDKAWNDRLAVLEATAILFPLGARKIFYEKYMLGRLSLAWIAEQAELPVENVAPVMNGFWPKVVEHLIARRVRMESRTEEQIKKPPASK